MSEISSITLPSGGNYLLKDATARSMIASLNQFTYEIVTTLPNAGVDTMYKIYLKLASTAGTDDEYEEFITIDKGASASTRYVWEKLGTITPPDLSNYVSKDEAGALAYKDTASGTVAVPKTYTTTFTGKQKSVFVTGTTIGSVSLTKSTVDVKPNATGTAANVYKPAGTNASSSVSGSCTVTADGTVAAPTISVKTAGSTTSVTPFGSAGTLPSATMPTYTVASGSETLTITAGSFSAGTLPSAGTAVTVKTGDAAYQASAPAFTGKSATGTISGTAAAQTFTGTDTYLKTAVEVGTGASFSGASMTSTGNYTPEATSVTTTTATTENKSITVS